MRLAVANLLGSNAPALVESATALRRDVARAALAASAPDSRLCGSPALPHESGVMPLRLRLGAASSRAAKVSARLSARWIEGCLNLFFRAVAGAVRWLLWLFFSTFTSAVTSVACLSFLTAQPSR